MLSKQELQEATAVILGTCGFVSVSIGVAFFTTGMFGVVIIKAGDFFKTYQHELQEAAIDGSLAIGGGMMMTGLGLVIAKSYQQKQLLENAFGKVLLEHKQSPKSACYNCRYYSASNQYLACAVQPHVVNTELAANCSDWTASKL